MSNGASWFSRFFRNQTGEVSRAVTAADIARLLQSRQSTHSGINVTPDNALQVAAVYACVRVLADSIGMLPLRLFQEGAGGSREIAKGHRLDRLLNNRPNEIHTPFEFKRLLVGMLALRGNAYVWKFAPGTSFEQLIPLNPARVKVVPGKDTMRPTYTYRKSETQEINISADNIVHLRGLSSDGIMGHSVIQAAAEAVGLSLRTEQHGAKLFANAASPSGILKHPQMISADAAKRLRDSFAEQHAGSDNAHKTMLLEEGMSWEKMSMTSEEAQFLETRRYQRSEIAMFFGVPPHMLGDVDRGTSWGSGIEQQGIGFVTYTLLPWLTNIAQAFGRDLLSPSEDLQYSFSFMTDDLTRPDFSSRQTGRATQLTNGVISANEWRQFEGLNPRPNGDTYRDGQPPQITRQG
jgi:HK97 family phage portal protein